MTEIHFYVLLFKMILSVHCTVQQDTCVTSFSCMCICSCYQFMLVPPPPCTPTHTHMLKAQLQTKVILHSFFPWDDKYTSYLLKVHGNSPAVRKTLIIVATYHYHISRVKIACLPVPTLVSFITRTLQLWQKVKSKHFKYSLDRFLLLQHVSFPDPSRGYMH